MTASRHARHLYDEHEIAVDVTIVDQLRTPLEVHVISHDPQSAVVQVSGEIDLSNADAIAGVLTEQVERGRRSVRLDVSRLTFCDCAGLNVIAQAHNQLLASHGSLVLIGVHGTLARLLAVSHLDETLFGADRTGGPPRLRRLPDRHSNTRRK